MKQVKKSRRRPNSREEARRQDGQRRRKRRKRKYTLYYLLLIIVLLTTGVSLSMTVFFNVDNYHVENTGEYTEQQVINASGVRPGDNLVRLNLGQVEQDILKKCPQLDAVHTDRSFPNTFSIVCTPAVAAYSCPTPDGTFVYLSSGGRVMQVGQPQPLENTMRVGGFPVDRVKVGDFVDLQSQIGQQVQQLRQSVQNAGLAEITSLEITGENSANIVYQNRITIRIGDLSKSEYILTGAAKIIHDYIGASESGTLFYDDTVENTERAFHFLPNATG